MKKVEKNLEAAKLEKAEIIDKALLESVGGAGAEDQDWCGISCSIFSMDVCNWDFCSFSN
jgi:hypothetical protein